MKNGGATARFTAPVLLLGIFLIVGVLLTVARGSGGALSKSPKALKPFEANIELPEVIINDGLGHKTLLSSQIVVPTLVTFWNSSCEECKTGLKDQQAYYQAHGGDYRIILINTRDERLKADESLKANNITLPTFYDDGTAFEKLAGTMPSSYFIKDDKIVYYFPGRIDNTHLNALFGN